ncbi:MAG: hypothetical protein LBR26_10545 [Prevotella sp.]|jgi:hypothetical protein|nr:hypothetical protein [Prevotella sp.]
MWVEIIRMVLIGRDQDSCPPFRIRNPEVDIEGFDPFVLGAEPEIDETEYRKIPVGEDNRVERVYDDDKNEK